MLFCKSFRYELFKLLFPLLIMVFVLLIPFDVLKNNVNILLILRETLNMLKTYEIIGLIVSLLAIEVDGFVFGSKSAEYS